MGGSRPGTDADASTAGTTGPLSNQCSAARSMCAAQQRNGTRRSAKVVSTPSSVSSSRRNGRRECRWVRAAKRRNCRATESPYTSLASGEAQSRTSRSVTASVGSAATSAPFTAPIEVPSTMSGVMPARNSARNMPTSTAPSTPPPPSTNATGPAAMPLILARARSRPAGHRHRAVGARHAPPVDS